MIDAADGSTLYAEDLDTPWHPASLTKMMTAYVTFVAIQEGTLSLHTKIACSKFANSQGPTKVGLPVGAQITVEAALQALIMKSANDVAVMLAEAVSGSHEAFVDFMNGTAGRLGMTRTKFAMPTVCRTLNRSRPRATWQGSPRPSCATFPPICVDVVVA